MNPRLELALWPVSGAEGTPSARTIFIARLAACCNRLFSEWRGRGGCSRWRCYPVPRRGGAYCMGSFTLGNKNSTVGASRSIG